MKDDPTLIEDLPDEPYFSVPAPPPPIELQEYTRYDTVTGRILSTGLGVKPADGGAHPSGTVGFIEGLSLPDEQYVDIATGELQPMTDNPATIDLTELALGGTVTINNVPPHSQFYFDEADDITVDDGVLAVVAQSVGDYEFFLQSPGHRWKTFTFKVVGV